MKKRVTLVNKVKLLLGKRKKKRGAENATEKKCWKYTKHVGVRWLADGSDSFPYNICATFYNRRGEASSALGLSWMLREWRRKTVKAGRGAEPRGREKKPKPLTH